MNRKSSLLFLQMRRKTKYSLYSEQTMEFAQALIIRKFGILLLNISLKIPSHSNLKLAIFT
jgi:hypothetical protein